MPTLKETTPVTRNQLIAELTKSPHGKLQDYVPLATLALQHEPEFFAHLLVWNDAKGQIRDSKTALPTISLTSKSFDREYTENSMALLAKLSPRDLLKAYRFLRELNSGGGRKFAHVATRYIRNREQSRPWWERTALQHQRSLKELYTLFHIKPGEQYAWFIKRHANGGSKFPAPAGSLFEAVHNLAHMSDLEAAGTIISRKIPFLIAQGALGKRIKDTGLLMALIQSMSGPELINNTKLLEKLGVRNQPELRHAFEQALSKATTSGKSILKATKAIEQVTDTVIKAKLQSVQEKQLKRTVDGNWLVLADRSGSMAKAIELGRQVASILSRSVSGKVWLCFFNTQPTCLDVTGKTFEEVTHATRSLIAQGGTVIGAGLDYATVNKFELDGIAIISDGGDTGPSFPRAYQAYAKKFEREPAVYYYRLPGDPDYLSQHIKGTFDENFFSGVFDIASTSDYYSLPNLVQTMRTNRYSLADEILAMPLLKLSDIFKNSETVD